MFGWLPTIITFLIFKFFIPFSPIICFVLLHLFSCIHSALLRTSKTGISLLVTIPSQRTTMDLKILEGTATPQEKISYTFFILTKELMTASAIFASALITTIFWVVVIFFKLL